MKNLNRTALLWFSTGFLLLALLFARVVYPELIWATAAIALPLVATLSALIHQNRQALRTRSAAYGLNSAVTILLVIAIVGVLNFLFSRYPQKLDLTKNKVHTLSDQTEKVIQGLKNPVKAVVYAKASAREQIRPLLDNLKAINPKFEVEYVDPDKEPARARQAGIKKYGTLQLIVGARDNKIEDANEEKITNTLIKLLKDKAQVLCAITGHGEKSFSSLEADGLDSAKKQLANQSYEVKDVNLVQEAKVPDTCSAIAVMGPSKAFFEPEVKAIREYLANGGRGIIAVDVNVKGGEYSPEIFNVLADWHVKANQALIVDPLSRMFGVDASVSIIATFSKDNAITKDFQGNLVFPFARPLEVVTGAPAGLNVQWLTQTTPKSWGESDLSELAKGQVQMNEGKDKMGPLTVAVAVEGKQKDSKAARNTRLVVFGTSLFATNNYSRHGGNMDFFMNAASWVMEDESLISIRAKEEGPGKVELSQKAGQAVFLITVIILPLLISAAGVTVWAMRRRL